MRHAFMLCLALAAITGLSACGDKSAAKGGEDAAYCKSVKPGTVTTVNHFCVIMPDDPVDPKVTRDFKGQKVGFCCPGCLKKWDAMNDQSKDAALKFAVAKGKP